MSPLSHFTQDGQAHMVDIGAKAETRRKAVATGSISMRASTLALLCQGQTSKGDVIGVARLAAIQGSKHTALLIPLCHPLSLTHVNADFRIDSDAQCIHLTVSTETCGRTGVEMEALTAVMTGLLTLYDMLKAVDRGMRIEGIRLLEKQGGKSGHWQAGLASDTPPAEQGGPA